MCLSQNTNPEGNPCWHRISRWVYSYSYIGYICASSLYNVTEPVLGGFIVCCLGFKCLWNKQCKGLEVTFATLFKHVSWYIDDFSNVSFVGFCKWPWRMKLPVDGWSPKQNLNLGFIFFGRLGDRQKESLWHTLALNATCGKITCALLSHSRKFDFSHHLLLIFAQLSRFGMWGTTCIKCLSCTNKQISCQKNSSEVLRCTYNLYRYTDTQITYDIYDILL